jgi:hypothetical protein
MMAFPIYAKIKDVPNHQPVSIDRKLGNHGHVKISQGSTTKNPPRSDSPQLKMQKMSPLGKILNL